MTLTTSAFILHLSVLLAVRFHVWKFVQQLHLVLKTNILTVRNMQKWLLNTKISSHGFHDYLRYTDKESYIFCAVIYSERKLKASHDFKI